jgi:multicomponent Na+:H+ antiporter subunit F
MTAWLVTAAVLQAVFVIVALSVHRGSPFERVVALELASAIETLVLLSLAQGFDRDVYFDIAVIFAVVSFVGNLVYVRSLERWV